VDRKPAGLAVGRSMDHGYAWIMDRSEEQIRGRRAMAIQQDPRRGSHGMALFPPVKGLANCGSAPAMSRAWCAKMFPLRFSVWAAACHRRELCPAAPVEFSLHPDDFDSRGRTRQLPHPNRPPSTSSGSGQDQDQARPGEDQARRGSGRARIKPDAWFSRGWLNRRPPAG
jgi:hypothetical protein